MEFRDLKKQYQVLREEMDRAVLDAMASGAYIMGPQVRELEQQLAEYVGVNGCAHPGAQGVGHRPRRRCVRAGFHFLLLR